MEQINRIISITILQKVLARHDEQHEKLRMDQMSSNQVTTHVTRKK